MESRGVDPVALDRRIRELATARRKLLAEMASLLRVMDRTRAYVALGFSSIIDYASATLDFSPKKTRDLIELSGRAAGLPRIRAAFEAGEVPWTKLRTIAAVASEETEAGWLEAARTSSSRALEFAVADAQGARVPKVKITLELTPEQCADLEDAVRELRRERDEAIPREEALVELARRGLAATAGSPRPPFQVVLYRCETCARVTRESREGPVAVEASTAARAGCDADLVSGMEPGRIGKTIPSAIRRFVLARDHGRCVVPGCSGRDFAEVHHLVPRSEGGDHDPRRLALVCKRHHTAVHDGALRIEGEAPELRFFVADGSELRRDVDKFHHVAAPLDLSDAAITLLGAIAERSGHLDELIERTGLTASRAFAATTELELAGLARRLRGVAHLVGL